MGYVVEDVSVEDRKKILTDVAYEPRFEKRFMDWLIFRDPTGPYNHMRWAIDREHDNYLFRSELSIPDIDNDYQFFFNGKMYEVGVRNQREANGGRRVEVYSTEVAGELKALPDGFKEELTAAFRDYGLRGYGERRRDGKLACYDVTPVFGGEA